MKLFDWLIKLLFPSKCVLCRRILDKNEKHLCRSCEIDGPRYPIAKRKRHFLDSFVAVWYYERNVRRSILHFKFYGARHKAADYGALLAPIVREELEDGIDLLTWVPVSPWRKFTRGYDQAALLARTLGRELGMEPVPLLKKIRNNRRQSSIRGEAQRRANVLGVYRVLSPGLVSGKRVLLVDDVVTTGATAGECARMLRIAGAEKVHCVAIAAARK